MATNNFTADGGEWNTAGNWSLGHVPTSSEDTTFTGIVTPGVSLTVTTTGAFAKSVDFSTAGNAFILSTVSTLAISGSLICKAGMTLTTGGNWIHFQASGNLDTAGINFTSWITVNAGTLTIINNAVNLIGAGNFQVRNAGTSLVTNNNNITCGSFTDGGYAGAVTLTLGSSTINATNVSFAAATLTVTANTAAINITGNSVTSNFGGKTWGGTITFNKTAGQIVTMGDSPTFGNTVLTQGTLELNGKTLTTGTFSSSNSNTRVLRDTAGGGKIIVTGLTSTVFDMSTATNLTVSNSPDIDIGTSNLTQSADVTFAGGGKTFGDFKVTKHAGDYDCIVTGANTFGIITLETPDATYQYSHLQLPASATTTCTGFVSNGTSSYQNSLNSSSAAAHTLSDTAGTNNVTYTTITYSTVTGGAVWLAKDCVDGGNNTGWYFGAILTCDTGSFTLTGQTASLLSSRVLGATGGVYTITGTVADLILTEVWATVKIRGIDVISGKCVYIVGKIT